MFDDQLNDMLRCPITRQPVSPMSSEDLERLNSAIASSNPPFDSSGEPVTSALEGAYLREDGVIAFPIRDDLLSLHPHDAIALDSLDASSQE